jgi:N-acetyl sugar amidotransferase
MSQTATRNEGEITRYGLPQTVVFCSRCVISNQRPITSIESKHTDGEAKQTTRFDANGVCDACRWAEIKETRIDWDARHRELEVLLEKHRKQDGSYDVVVPASGGKDSAYVAHILKAKYGMHPLTVTWAPHIWTETGLKNHQNLIKSGFDNILYSPNGSVHRLLTRLAFENLGHPFQPFIVGQRVVGPKTALKHGVKLVFYGENVAEYGNRIEDNYVPTMYPQLFTCFDMKDDATILAGQAVGTLKKDYEVTANELVTYQSPALQEIADAGVEVHYMSYYRKWVPQENYYYAVQNTKFEPSPERTRGSYSRYSGLDDKLEWFHYYMMYIKFGMGRATADASQEIRSKKITREEAVALVNRYDGEFPDLYFKDFLDYTGISEKQFWETVDSYRPEHLWSYKDGQWTLRHPVR